MKSPLQIVSAWINAANITLIFLCVITLCNCFLSIQSLVSPVHVDTQILTVRIVYQDSTPFNQPIYFALWKNSIWQIEDASKSIQIGQVYTLQADILSYSLQNRQQSYSLSLGVQGQIKSKKILSTQTCSLICLSIKKLTYFRRYVQQYFIQTICSISELILSFLYTQCTDVAALSIGLVLGGTQSFSDETKQNFKAAGLSHLVAVSGFQVICLITFLESWLIKSRSSVITRFIAYLLALAGLIFLVGPQPPVLRSSMSIIISLGTIHFLGRRLASFRVLTYSALLLLWLNPLYILSLSFQLSFLASLGLLFSPKTKNPSLPKWLENTINLLWESSFTFLFTLPIIINLNSQISLLSIPLNILYVPLIPFVTLSDILGLLPGIGEILILPAIFIQSLMLELVHILNELSIGTIAFTRFQTPEILGYYIALIGFSLYIKILNTRHNSPNSTPSTIEIFK
jgi:ComEC/Rec2-related protein